MSHFKNPITLWLKWLIIKNYYQLKYRHQRLRIKYLAYISNCTIGICNTINQRAILSRVVLGNYTYVGEDNKLNGVTIGKFSCLGPEVMAGLGRHPTRKFGTIHPVFYSIFGQSGVTFADKCYFDEAVDIKIGNDVWIGARSIILDGVSISDGVIVAAGSVVNKNVPPYAIVGGVPARIIRYRYSDEIINRLVNLKWWDKDEEWLRNNFKKFHNVEDLILALTNS